MDYKEMRELLLQKKSISKEEARQILELWQKIPRAYTDFLHNRSAFMLLDCYCKADLRQCKHVFEQTSVRVPSAAVAEKFFQLRDDAINTSFKNIVTIRAFNRRRNLDICAWPYLDRRCASYYELDFILELLCDPHYVFNFEKDLSGKIFETLLKKLGKNSDWLAINSFNIAGWTEHCIKEDPVTIRLFLMAQHATAQDEGEEASFRKLLLNYLIDIEKGMKIYYQLAAKSAGIIMS